MASKSFRAFGVEWAPMNIPMERRLQTLAAIFYTLIFFTLSFWTPFILLYLVFTPLCLMPLICFAVVMWDRKTPYRGGRRSQWMRNWRVWKYFGKYFPAKMIKTADLDPSKNYIFGCHPHGVLSSSHFVCFGTEATGFSLEFPGIKPHLLTLNMNFYIPFYRSFIMMAGACSVSKESIEYILSHGPGHAACIVIGGAQEALDAHEDNTSLTLKHRKGFVKMALTSGASLVPVYSFGENTLFHQMDNPEGSWLRRLQNLMKRVTGVSPVMFKGRGVFQYTVGMIPYRTPLTIVIGAPIDVPKIENPTSREVDEYHKKYMDSLYELHKKYKKSYSANPNEQLVFV